MKPGSMRRPGGCPGWRGRKKSILGMCAVTMSACMASVHAESLLRVACADEDAGARVVLNGQPVGGCTVDVFLPAGSYQIRVTKAVGASQEQVFETKVMLIELQPRSVSVTLSEPRLTAEAARLQARRAAARVLAMADAGDVESMHLMAALHERGEGVEKSAVKAREWREQAGIWQQKHEQATFEAELAKAHAGDTIAMQMVARLYDEGKGVSRSPTQAALWRQKLQEKNREMALESARFFGGTAKLAETASSEGVGGMIGFSTFAPTSILADVVASPTATTRQAEVRSAAVMRPSSWARPDSMMARAVHQKHSSWVAEK